MIVYCLRCVSCVRRYVREKYVSIYMYDMQSITYSRNAFGCGKNIFIKEAVKING